jgi:hypothetical protein
MAEIRHFVKFKKVEVSGPRPFEELVTKIIPSVISFGLGYENAERPDQFFGTAFGISLYHKSGPTDVFLTCSHVFDNLMAKLGEHRDKIKFISLYDKGKFTWKKVETIKRFAPYKITGDLDESDLAETHDISLCRIPGTKVLPLPLSDDKYIYGAEVGILGFPNYEHLQKKDPQPHILKTIISGELIYPIETGKGQVNTDRLALGCVTGHGFSGSPVFSIENGHIVGMHDYAPTEKDIWMMRERKPQCRDPDVYAEYRDTSVYAEYPGGISFAIPSTRLCQGIHLLETHCYHKAVQRFLR